MNTEQRTNALSNDAMSEVLCEVALFCVLFPTLHAGTIAAVPACIQAIKSWARRSMRTAIGCSG
jgi:hypothetical protein